MRLISHSAVRFIMAASIPLALAGTATTAAAQYGRQQQRQQQQLNRVELFQWQGQVDKEIRIQLDNRQASLIQVGNNERTRRRGGVNAVTSLPNRPGTVYVQVLEGRGRVDVVQQPDANNGYTAVIRLRDPQSGSSRYRIEAYWQGDRYGRGTSRRGY